MIVEVVYRWPDDREEVRYRRPYGTLETEKMIDEVHELQRRAVKRGEECCYFWRIAAEPDHAT